MLSHAACFVFVFLPHSVPAPPRADKESVGVEDEEEAKGMGR